jgi:hypothetical protein
MAHVFDHTDCKIPSTTCTGDYPATILMDRYLIRLATCPVFSICMYAVPKTYLLMYLSSDNAEQVRSIDVDTCKTTCCKARYLLSCKPTQALRTSTWPTTCLYVVLPKMWPLQKQQSGCTVTDQSIAHGRLARCRCGARLSCALHVVCATCISAPICYRQLLTVGANMHFQSRLDVCIGTNARQHNRLWACCPRQRVDNTIDNCHS